VCPYQLGNYRWCSRPLCSSQDTGGPGPLRTKRRRRRSWPKVGPSGAEHRRRPFPQDPTACSARSSPGPAFRAAEAAVLTGPGSDARTE